MIKRKKKQNEIIKEKTNPDIIFPNWNLKLLNQIFWEFFNNTIKNISKIVNNRKNSNIMIYLLYCTTIIIFTPAIGKSLLYCFLRGIKATPPFYLINKCFHYV